jgi:hypothetical protein
MKRKAKSQATHSGFAKLPRHYCVKHCAPFEIARQHETRDSARPRMARHRDVSSASTSPSRTFFGRRFRVTDYPIDTSGRPCLANLARKYIR